MDAHDTDVRGNIQIIFGPMFSGKSTELLRRMKRYGVAKRRCILLKYKKDDRYHTTAVCTHDRQSLDAVPCETLSAISDRLADVDVIGIDEGQFFPDIVSFCEEMANQGKVVIVAALDGTFQRKAFGSILELVPLAENVTKLTSVCMMCFHAGSFSKRIGAETAVEVIGGADKYVAVCRACFHRNGTVTSAPSNASGAVAAETSVEVDGGADAAVAAKMAKTTAVLAPLAAELAPVSAVAVARHHAGRDI